MPRYFTEVSWDSSSQTKRDRHLKIMCGENMLSLGNGETFRMAATEICLVVRIRLEGAETG